ncbi:hypothetical protein [Pseudoduganella violacea]|uniref:Uncharacterized protein n=1 Tax=Pseudoduganella violacea TaxID=1715466 RepID=A0A7W5B8D4_9BURK|nr:hypothetical protein [Pseudoduganella violacea]MBB3118301.1 hypothetical protein [Pseudoduganella violacea]
MGNVAVRHIDLKYITTAEARIRLVFRDTIFIGGVFVSKCFAIWVSYYRNIGESDNTIFWLVEYRPLYLIPTFGILHVKQGMQVDCVTLFKDRGNI